MSNREFKSDVFSMLMEVPAYALDVYNALNHSNYQNPDEVQIYKLENGFKMTIRNDASFIIDSYLSLYEHQSSPNRNMPLRFLIYVTNLFRRIIEQEELDLMSPTLQKIPAPRFVVFYNGTEKRPEIEHLKLSDAFEHPLDQPDLELQCTVYNINPNNNRDLMGRSSILCQYTAFVERVRMYQEKYPLDVALDLAIQSCVDDHILEDFLKENRAEVKNVAILDYTYERQKERADKKAKAQQETIEQQAATIDQQASTIDQQASTIDQQASENEKLRELLKKHGIDPDAE